MPNYRPAWEHLAQEDRALGRTAQAAEATAHAQSLKPAAAAPAKRKS